MTKFDHRLKRLEGKTGLKKKDFDYWLITESPASTSRSKQIQDIEAGKIPGKMGTFFSPEKKTLIIISAIPRLSKRALKEKDQDRQKEISFAKTIDVVDLTDEELETEIRSVKKELEQCQS